MLIARHLSKAYRRGSRLLGSEQVMAINDVSLEVREGEVVGLVGATGAGKSTLGMLLVRLLEPDGGAIELEGQDFLAAGGTDLKGLRRRIQMVFQDPYEASSPRMTIEQVVREPLDVWAEGSMDERLGVVKAVLAAVRLPSDPSFLSRHAHELSGGQLQRVILARALVLEPKMLVADEPVSMLDPSEQTKALQLLKHLQVERGMAMLFVSHDLAVVLRVADRVVVMHDGKIVEQGRSQQVLLEPQHEVTRAMLTAAGGQRFLASMMDPPADRQTLFEEMEATLA